jgi:predicted nuclease with TOPRIM domain
MDLSAWTLEEAAKVGSLNKRSKAIGLSRQTILDWRDCKAGFLSDKGATAIANYLGIQKSPEEMRTMFDMPIHPYLDLEKKTGIQVESNPDFARLEQENALLRSNYENLREDHTLLQKEVDNLKEYVEFLAVELRDVKENKNSNPEV